jgi:DNA topoisomerase-2
MPPKVKKERTAEDYKVLDQISHALLRPDMYIGSITSSEHQDWVFDLVNRKLVFANLTLADGIKRICLEILANSGDNVDSSRRMGIDPGIIEMNMNNTTVSIRNNGSPIPVEPAKGYENNSQALILVPHIIFGVMMSSSNYDDKNVDRTGAGKNGVGAKAGNIFSTQFIVRVGDPKRGQEYIGVWTNNMKTILKSECSPGYAWNGTQWIPITQNPYTGPSYVEVTWTLDFPRFELTEYPTEAYNIFSRYLIDYSLTCKIPVKFNGTEYDYRNIRDYAELYWSEDIISRAIIHYEWEGGKEPVSLNKLSVKAKEQKISKAESVELIPIIEMLVLEDATNAVCFSYVNGLLTYEGGIHVDEAYKKISAPIVHKLNDALNSKRKEKDKRVSVNDKDVKGHVSMILNCRLSNPEYNSQCKTMLKGLKDSNGKPVKMPSINIDENFTKQILKWQDLIAYLIRVAEAKVEDIIGKTDGKKKKYVKVNKGEDANKAGGPDSQKCMLYLVEGKSACNYPLKRIDLSPGGKDFAGFYPLKGKFVNISNTEVLDLVDNQEYIDIKRLLGLEEGVNYLIPENKAKLRYGFVMITTDADTDGTHIRTLILNLFHRKWPSLLQLGMIGYLATPAVRIIEKDICIKKFYTTEEYELWKEANSELSKKYKPFYYKGLGRSTDEDILDDYNSIPMLICYYDQNSANSMEVAFTKNKESANIRKDWITKWRDVSKFENIIVVPENRLIQKPIEKIINYDLINYTLESIFRGIPSYRDGLKKSQRQSLYFILKFWNFGKSDKNSIPVERIATLTAEEVNYHHGVVNLMDTIINMAQDFVGSNNMNVFKKVGQFGARADGGEMAAAGRYSETCPEWWLSYVFDKDMVNHIERRAVEELLGEPLWIPCDVPLGIINGSQGLATGWSTYIPPHNIFDIINWLITRSQNGETKPLVPWFNGFKGIVEIKQKGVLPDAIIDEEIKNEFDRTEVVETVEETTNTPSIHKRSDSKLSLVTKGLFKVTKDYGNGSFDVEITEIPVGRWIHPYHKWLEQLIEEKLLSSFDDVSTSSIPHFYLTKFKAERVNCETLKLRKTFGMSNMVMIDDNGYPKHYENTSMIMEEYYRSMLGLYEEIKIKRLQNLLAEIQELHHCINFIKLVNDDKIIILKTKKSEVIKQMEAYKIPKNILSLIKAEDFSEEEIESLEKKIAKHTAEYQELYNIPAVNLWMKRLLVFKEALIKKKYGQ